MKLRITMFVCLLVYITLNFVTFMMLINGPLPEIFKKDNVDFTESFVNMDEITEPINWPALQICKTPFFKDAERYNYFINKGLSENGFDNETEFEQLKKDIFFLEPNETIFALTIGTDFMKSLKRPFDLPIKYPYVDTQIGDLSYMGACSIINLRELKTYLIEKNEVSPEAIDSKFYLIVWIKVNFTQEPKSYNMNIIHVATNFFYKTQ